MVTGIPRRLHVSLVVVIALSTMTGGAYAAKDASSDANTVSSGSAGLLSGFPTAGHSAIPFAAAGGSALMSRDPKGTFGSFEGESPQSLTVDGASGDVYVLDTNSGKLLRFTAGGAPADFSVGPGKGSNAIPGLSLQHFPSFDQVAVDNSGGPSTGNVYVTESGSGEVKVFASSGEELGALNGSGTPAKGLGEDCGVAVDPSNGDVYVASWGNRIWRYSPTGPAVEEKDYSGGIETTSVNPCGLAVADGHVYAKDWKETPIGSGGLYEYEASAFSEAVPAVAGTQLAGGARAVAADSASGDVYVDEGEQVSVLDSAGNGIYSFAAEAIGSKSTGVAVRAGGNAYVADSTNHQIHIYGPTLQAGSRAELGSFGSFGGESPQALAVDDGSGDVYALDSNDGELLRFTAGGAPADFSAGPGKGSNAIPGLGLQRFPSFDQVAVDNSGGPSAGNVYVTESGSGEVRVFAPSGEELGALNGSGTPAKGLGEDCGVAVDPSNGDVYVASWGNRIWRYSPTGPAVEEKDYSGGIETTSVNPCGLAVAGGHVYAKDWKETPVGSGGLYEYETSVFSEAVPAVAGTQLVGSATAVAADSASGDVYVDEGEQVSVLDSAGNGIYSFAAEEIGSKSTGVAVRAGGNAYVADSTNHQIHIYGPFSAPPPIVKTSPATSVAHVKATLNGRLDPNNGLPITSCSFQIGPDTSYSEPSVPCAQGETFTAPADVSAQLSGLTPGATFHFRLHITTASGAFDGEDESFETVPASTTPEVRTGKGSILSTTSTEMQGTIDPDNNPVTDCHFEYVTDAAFQTTGFSDLSSGASIPCDQASGSIPVDYEDHQVTATATGLDPTRIYRYRLVAENSNGPGEGQAMLLPGPPIPETTGSPTRTTTIARLDSRVIPHGADTSYWFEYVTDVQYQTNGYAAATSTPHQPLTTNEVQEVLVRDFTNTTGNFKLSFGGYTTPDLPFVASAAEVQAALSALPSIGQGNIRVESTLGSVDVNDYLVTFTGALGNVNVEPLVVSKGTPPSADFVEVLPFVDGGPSDRSSLVSMVVNGLRASTTYHYRVVADNGAPGGPAYGEGQTLTTRSSETPLSHGSVAGPPGSDRAWEEVNAPDTNDSRVLGALMIADSGERAIYRVDGGTPGSTYGGETLGRSDDQFAERTPDGWQLRELFPTRAQAPGNVWLGPWGSTELNELYATNYDTTQTGPVGVFRLTPGVPAQTLLSEPFQSLQYGPTYLLSSDDGSRVVAELRGTRDPAHPVEPETPELYDLSSGSPKMIGLLPGNMVPPCGVTYGYTLSSSMPRQGWITPDGSHVFFGTGPSPTDCQASNDVPLYDRDLVNSTTTLIASSANFIRYAAGAVFFTTTESLVSGDHGGNDIYRYQVDDGSIHCVTCSTAIPAEVEDEGQPPLAIAVSADGSRAYFISHHRLVPGASARDVYRVDVASGAVAYVAPATFFSTSVSADSEHGGSLSPDGSVFAFWSHDPGLNAVNGQQDGGTAQYYLYDDRDRSLVCASCPPDGTAPRGGVEQRMARGGNQDPNQGVVTSHGEFFFTTPTPLVSTDQNTAAPGEDPVVGSDIYEWRDGRLLLVTDGKTETYNGVEPPSLDGVAGGGRDVFFTQAAALTPDAIDSSQRLYDARIGGGFEFPQAPAPCSLEACQGTASPPPDDATPSSLSFSGPGNQAGEPVPSAGCAGGECAKKSASRKRCAKGTVRKRGKCVKKPKSRKPKSKGKRVKRANRNKGGAK